MSNLLKVQRTHFTRNEDIKQEWILIDAAGQNLGRLASRIAHRLRGKHRTDYASHQDIGDCIVVINAAKIDVTGKKREQKVYYHHTGYTGNLRKIRFSEMLAKDPNNILKLAVKRMLPAGSLGRGLLGNLHIYAEAQHLHSAQKPQKWEPVFK